MKLNPIFKLQSSSLIANARESEREGEFLAAATGGRESGEGAGTGLLLSLLPPSCFLPSNPDDKLQKNPCLPPTWVLRLPALCVAKIGGGAAAMWLLAQARPP